MHRTNKEEVIGGRNFGGERVAVSRSADSQGSNAGGGCGGGGCGYTRSVSTVTAMSANLNWSEQGEKWLQASCCAYYCLL